MLMRVLEPAPLLAAADEQADVVTRLATGDEFEALELTAEMAWGVAPRQNRVGYVARSALTRLPDRQDG